MKIGEKNKLKVKRISDIAYILEDGDEEIFLHKKEAKYDYEVGDIVDVFIYVDSKRRLAASEATPLITSSMPAFLEVVAIKENLGFFLIDGMPKDLLLSYDDFPYKEEYYPMVGDKLLVYLKTANNTFRARLLPKNGFTIFPEDGDIKVDEYSRAYIIDISDSGITAITTSGSYSIFIPKSFYRGEHRICEKIMPLVTKMRDERHFSGSLLLTKKAQLSDDSKMILEYLKKNKTVSLGDKSDPIDIYQVFRLSKKAFKDAIGILYKEKLITISDNSISLIID